MESKDEFKKIDNKNRTCYYFDDVMRHIDINFNDILLDEKSHKNIKNYINILIYDISFETFMGAKPLRIRFDKIDGFIKVYDGIRYLVLRDYEIYNAIYDRIKHLISENCGIISSINHDSARIRINSYNSLLIEKVMTFHNVIILIKSVVNKNKNDYFCNIFLEKGSYKESDTQYV